MIRSIIIAVLTAGIIGIGYWGYKEHEEKNSVLIHAENTYQRSFHELSYHMDMLHDKIGTSLAMNSGERLSPQFVDIWRITSQALGNVGQLPLSLLPFHKTEEFLSTIGDFTYRTAIRNLDDDPLTDKEVKTLTQLYSQAGELKDELRDIQYQSLNNNLRWMDVELALATQDNQGDQIIIDGFKTVENKVDGYSQKNDDTVLQSSHKEKTYDYIKGNWKSDKDIKQYAKDLFSIKNDANMKITKTGKGADVPMFTVSYEDDKNVYMDITQQGAHPVNIMVNRQINEKKLSLNDGLLKAEDYLKKMNYKNMDAIQSQEYQDVGIYTFLYQNNDVRIFPDSITLKVALDDGEIIGLNAREYLMNHHDRTIPKPSITEKEAKEFVNGQLKIQNTHMAIIENKVGEEVLSYEFLGTLNDETYRVFINAENGNEEKIEKLTGTETNFETNM